MKNFSKMLVFLLLAAAAAAAQDIVTTEDSRRTVYDFGKNRKNAAKKDAGKKDASKKTVPPERSTMPVNRPEPEKRTEPARPAPVNRPEPENPAEKMTVKTRTPVDQSDLEPLLAPFSDAGFDPFLAKLNVSYAIFSEDLALVRLAGKWGFIDRQGNEVIPPKYDEAAPFSEGLAAVRSNDKWGYIDRQGNAAIGFKYDRAGAFSQNLAIVETAGKLTAIDRRGAEILALEYDSAGPFDEDGRAPVELRGKRGFIDRRGDKAIPLIFEAVLPGSEGLFPVKLNDLWGVVDPTGKFVVEPKYKRLSGFHNGLAFASQTAGKTEFTAGADGFYIDRSGREYYEP